ncbi:DUF7010 family protein [Erythrobacter donghaensis]|uniref:DUF7010 family protein n=1 Tax=Erythrobacter donghaensis TaxID=267135 RepID=UPI001302860D|nr:hypothetical protein [Erythrobacter donghaensis]
MDFSSTSLADARREYLRTSTTGMPIAGLISWASLALALVLLDGQLPAWAVFTAAAAPFPLSMLIDRLRGLDGIRKESSANPVTQLFMQMIFVVALLIPLVMIAASATGSLDLLVLGMAILAGMVWVPHGWGADDPAGLRHFILRAVLCYTAYLVVPEPLRGAAIAGAAALTYVYAIAAMRKPSEAVKETVLVP